MQTNAALENFITKYRLALTSKAKDIRITTEEAGDLVASIALIKSDREGINKLETAINNLASQIQANSDGTLQDTNPGIDGGTFKN